MYLLLQGLLLAIIGLSARVEAQTDYVRPPNFPSPLGGPNELPFGYPPLLGLAYTGNYTTPRSRGETAYGAFGVLAGDAAIAADSAITTAKYPNSTTFDSFALDFGPGNLRIYVQLTIVSYPESTYNATFIGVNYNVTYTDFSGNTIGNASVIEAELDRANYSITLTGPIYLPEPVTLTNRSCARWVPYRCDYLGTGLLEIACGSRFTFPMTSAVSYNYLFPAGYTGFSNNGTLQNMLRPVWGIGVSRDGVGIVTGTWSCNQFRQARVEGNTLVISAAATTRMSWTVACLTTVTIMYACFS